MDPLNLSASIIAVLHLTSKVISYINDVRGAPTERGRFLMELNGISIILIHLQGPVEEAEEGQESARADSWSETLQLLNGPKGPLKQMEHTLLIVESKLAPAGGLKSVQKALTWPFRKEEVKELIGTIERQKTLLNLAHQNDHINMSRAMKHDMKNIAMGIANIQISKTLQDVHQWLSALDPSTNHFAALQKRFPGTGSWFTESPEFAHWRRDKSSHPWRHDISGWGKSSHLWLHGIPGCGKTILSSTIIENLQQSGPRQSGTAVAYFYFKFDESPRCENMLRSILMQLSGSGADQGQVLSSLYSSCLNGRQQPTMESLIHALHQMIEAPGEMFIVLDALDECENRNELLDCISTIGAWKSEDLHLLVTSRKEKDIDDVLTEFIAEHDIIPLQSVLVNNDIFAYVQDRLRRDRNLRRWQKDPKIQREIEVTLMEKADGMFRWAVCQLDQLGRCLTTQSLRKAINSLPKDLDSTYERILCSIDDESRDHAINILHWLVYSARPLLLEEVAEIVAIDVGGDPRFDIERRFQDPWDVMTICPSLFTIVDRSVHSFDGEARETMVRLSHFSVKEYLISTRIGQGQAKSYSIREIEANNLIAETCLAYLLQFNQPEFPSQSILADFPLIAYAARYWFDHLRLVEEAEGIALPLDLDQLLREENVFLNSIRFSDPDKHGDPCMLKEKYMLASPLYYASAFGLTQWATLLIERGADVNAKAGGQSTALQVAVQKGHENLVLLLIRRGADVNAEGGPWGDALQTASVRGLFRIAQLLIDHGANVNATRGEFGSALQAASGPSNIITKQLFLHRANIHADGCNYGNALQAASIYGAIEVVSLLMEHGADVNAKGGVYGSALQAASANRHAKIVALLLDHGADVNTRGGKFGSALHIALHGTSLSGSVEIAGLLLDKGADVDFHEGRSENAPPALQANSTDGALMTLILSSRRWKRSRSRIVGQTHQNSEPTLGSWS